MMRLFHEATFYSLLPGTLVVARSSMNPFHRQELVERLLGILLEFIPMDLPQDTRTALLEEPSGSWVVPPDTIHDSTIVMWERASLYWMWQDERTCCVNFLVHQATFDFGTMEGVQWTLEGSYEESTASVATARFSPTEVQRFEPVLVTSDNATMSPVRSFWKLASLRVLCVEFQVVTLMGTWHQNASVEPGAVMTCEGIHLAGQLPSKPKENIQLAQVVSLLEQYSTPQLEWRAPPLDSNFHRDYVSYSCQSLADVFRKAYSFLEDRERTHKKNLSGDHSICGGANQVSTPHASLSARTTTGSGSRRGLDAVKRSLGDSLVITGGLVATGASFVTPLGAAVSVAAVGVKDGVAAAARKGQNTRNSDKYQFGDVTRGVVSAIKEKRQARQQQKQDDAIFSGQTKEASSNNSGDKNSGRYVGVVGSSLGAAVGLAVVGGPLGLVAGSLLGGAATQEAIRRRNEPFELPHESSRTETRRPNLSTWDTDEEIVSQLEDSNLQHQYAHQGDHTKGWNFADGIRNVAQRGKQADGRDINSGYKFGDFSRGLFAKKDGAKAPSTNLL